MLVVILTCCLKALLPWTILCCPRNEDDCFAAHFRIQAHRCRRSYPSSSSTWNANGTYSIWKANQLDFFFQNDAAMVTEPWSFINYNPILTISNWYINLAFLAASFTISSTFFFPCLRMVNGDHIFWSPKVNEFKRRRSLISPDRRTAEVRRIFFFYSLNVRRNVDELSV